MHASSREQNVPEKKVVLNIVMTASQATEMKIELIKCFEAFAYCRSYGQEDFNLDPVYLLYMLESLENQIASLENK